MIHSVTAYVRMIEQGTLSALQALGARIIIDASPKRAVVFADAIQCNELISVVDPEYGQFGFVVNEVRKNARMAVMEMCDLRTDERTLADIVAEILAQI